MYSDAMRLQTTAEDLPPLKKPVNTLAIVPKSAKITVLARKAYNVLLWIAQREGVEKEVYRAPLAEVVKGIDYTSNDIALIKKHLRAMASTIVEWNSPTTGEGTKWSVCSMITHATITNERNQNFLEWGFAPPIRSELISPAVFAPGRLEILSQMHTHAGLALYEICSRYVGVGKTSRQLWRWWIPVLTGQPPSEKQEKLEYRFFKRDTLKTAIAEVSTISDIEVELIEHKVGKNVAEIQFAVKRRVQGQISVKNPPKPVDLALLKKATDIGISEERLEELVAKHGETDVVRGLNDLEARIEKAFPAPVADPFRYLSATLKKKPVVPEHPQDVEAASKQLATKKQAERKSAWQEEWMRRRREEVTKQLRQISPQEMKELEYSLFEWLAVKEAHPSVIKRLQSNGWDHPLVRHLMIDFYAKAAIGDDWDKPSPEELLEIASEETTFDA